MTTVDIDSITHKLKETRTPLHALRAPSESGIYAFYLKQLAEINEFPANEDGLIYIGSSSDLAQREFDHHFNIQSTGLSTLRRSLGAILKKDLALVAIPRSAGRSETDVRNYKFRADGEQRLTDWMTENLEVGICPIPSGYEAIEARLLTALKPVLNLKGWDNPYRAQIKALRRICADEARRNRTG